MRTALVLLLPLAILACQPPPSSGAEPAATVGPEPGAHAADQHKVDHAEVGKPAPDFELADLDGKKVHLADFKGKIVVLEWFNPGCPFVKAAHTKGSLKDAAKQATAKGVVWLAVNSGAPGKQGHGVAANRDGAAAFGMTHPILLDESGKVGHLYGATNTPHLFVVDAQGTLVYAGAVDNSPDGEGDSPEGGKLVSYVDLTLAALAAGQPVPTPSTRAYGCSVKYAK